MDIQRPDLKKRQQRRRLAFSVIGAIAMVAIVTLIYRIEPAAPTVEKTTLWTDTVKRGEMLREVRGPGILVPKEVRWIAAETAVRVERIVVRPGAAVTADSVILELSNPEVVDLALAAEAALAAAEADYTARQATLHSQLLDQRALQAQVAAEFEAARLQAEAEGELAQKGIIPSIQFRRSQLVAEQLQGRVEIEHQRIAQFEASLAAQLVAERARIAQLKNAADLRRRQADALQLRAGIDGVLQQVPVQEGQQLAAGSNLARVARPGLLMAELRVPETQAKDVLVGQPVRVDTRNGVVAGTVSRIDPAVLNGSVLVDVELSGELPAGARPDLSVDGVIEIERLADVLYVGRPAYGQADSTVRLFRLDADGYARRLPVQLGRASVSLIEVRAGLAVGDAVVLSDTSAWDDYDRLRIR